MGCQPASVGNGSERRFLSRSFGLAFLPMLLILPCDLTAVKRYPMFDLEYYRSCKAKSPTESTRPPLHWLRRKFLDSDPTRPLVSIRYPWL